MRGGLCFQVSPDLITLMKTLSEKNTRREFIKTASKATAAAAVSIATHAHAAGSDRIKVGIVGTGGRGSGAIVQNMLNEGCELHAVGEAFDDRLARSLPNIRKQLESKGKFNLNADRTFVGLDAYKHVIDASDMVILTTPPGFRPMMFEYAVEQGKHVFMEKPVCTDAAGYRRVLAAARKADEKGLKVVVGLQRRYEDLYLQSYDAIQAGEIGEVIGAQCYWNGRGVWQRPRKKLAETLGREPTEMEYQIYNWYYFTWAGGDNICEQHVHNLDVCNWFTGGLPVEGYGSGGRAVRTGEDTGEIFDHHCIEFKMANGGYYHSDSRHFPNSDNKVGEVIIGSKGRLEISSNRGAIFYDHKGKAVRRIQRNRQQISKEVEHAVLHQHVREDKPINNAYYGATSSMTAVFGRMCTYSGKRITWDDAVNSKVSLFPERLAWDANPRNMPLPDGSYRHAVPGRTEVL